MLCYNEYYANLYSVVRHTNICHNFYSLIRFIGLLLRAFCHYKISTKLWPCLSCFGIAWVIVW